MTSSVSSAKEIIHTPKLTAIPQQQIDAFQRSAVQHNPQETQAALKNIFGIDIAFDYDRLPELQAHYPQIQEYMQSYKTAINPFIASPIHFAAATGSLKDLQQITDSTLLNAKDQRGLTPLHYAIAAGHLETVLYLVDRCDDINYLTTPQKDSYLHYAAQTGNRKMLNIFLNKGLKPVANGSGMTPAHFWAFASDDLTGLKRLAKKGNPLHTASALPSPIAIQILKTLAAHPHPLTAIDYSLLAVNGARALLAAGIFSLNPKGPWSNFFTFWPLYGLHEIAGVAKQYLIGTMIPKESVLNQVAGPNGLVNSKMMGFMTGSKVPAGLTAVGSTVAVASHAFSSLANCKHESWGQKLLAGAVHLTNTAASLFDTYLAYEPFNRFDSLNEMDRATSSHVQECVDKPEAATCRESYKFALSHRFGTAPLGSTPREQAQWECARAQQLQKPLRTQFHPDQNLSNTEQAKRAFQNIGFAKDALCDFPEINRLKDPMLARCLSTTTFPNPAEHTSCVEIAKQALSPRFGLPPATLPAQDQPLWECERAQLLLKPLRADLTTPTHPLATQAAKAAAKALQAQRFLCKTPNFLPSLSK